MAPRSWFKGKHVIILVDNDAAGRKHGDLVASRLYGIAASVKIVLLPDLDESEDVADWLAAGHTLAELEAIVEATPCYEGTAEADSNGKAETNGHAGTNGKAKGAAAAALHTDELDGAFRNYDEVDDGHGKKVKVGRPPKTILSHLLKITDGWPKRVEGRLFVPDGDKVRWLQGMPQTFGWINSQLDETMLWVEEGVDKTSRTVFDAYLRQQAEAFDAVEPFPHWPKFERHFYHHPALEGSDGKAFEGLLDFFSPATDVDRSLIMANYLTLFWGGPFGHRPAFLYEAAEGQDEAGRGVGKSTVVKCVAYLLDGHIDVDPLTEFKQVRTDLLSPSALTRRAVFLDNVKRMRFSWSELESVITTDWVGGHQMYLGFARRPNTLTWLITLNNASLSKDMSQRCVIVHLNRPKYGPDWVESLEAYTNANRWAIVGDIIALLKAGGPKLAKYSRWAKWEQDVLACVPNAEACQRIIALRQGAIDADQEESDIVREAFVRAIRLHLHDPETAVLFIPSDAAADIYNRATNNLCSPQQATLHIQTLAIPELRKVRHPGRGFRWTGLKAGAEARKQPAQEFSCDPDKLFDLFPNRTRAGGRRFRR
jgi:hypothetical protein